MRGHRGGQRAVAEGGVKGNRLPGAPRIAVIIGVSAIVVGATGGALICTGCGPGTATATDGTLFVESAKTPDPVSSALVWSGARDLPCAIDQVHIERPF